MEPLGPLRPASVELAEDEPGRTTRVVDDTWLPDRREDQRHATEHALRADGLHETLGVVDPVLEGHHGGVVAEQGVESSGGIGGVGGLHGEHHRVDRTDVAGVVRRGHLRDVQIPEHAPDPQPSPAERVEVGTTGDQRNLSGPSLEDAASEVPADPACAEHGDPHQLSGRTRPARR
jgi:hypothetical protein